jgi:uncharacterized protein YbjT (DUF2867 family)
MIVVTAPTGQIGSQVVDKLLSSDASLRLIARDPAKLSDEVLDRAEVVQGSHGDPDVVATAFDGADAVFWLLPPDPTASSVDAAYVDFTRPAAEVFARQDGLRVVGVSALGRGTPIAGQAGYVTGSLAMDDLIAGSGVAYRALTNPSFMDNLLRQIGPIREQGMFFSPSVGDLRAPSCATRDIAAVAVRWLLDSSWTGFEEVPVLGPEDISFDDMAATMTEVLARPIAFRQIPGEAFKQRMLDAGMSDAMAQGLLDMARAKDQGLDNGVTRTPQATTPTSFRTWCEDTLKPAVEA